MKAANVARRDFALQSAELQRSRAERCLSIGDRTGARAFAVSWVSWLVVASKAPRKGNGK
jgi:hypothetical protein